jgi:hypothetical protein
MLHSLRKQRYGFSRSVVTVLVALWLSLAFQPCVMAGVQAMESMPCDNCPEHSMAQHNGAQHDTNRIDCSDADTCVSMIDKYEVDASGFISTPSAKNQAALISWITDYPPRATPCYNSNNVLNIPVDSPPLLRFCILQI